MRIVIDMQGAQTASRLRGIGRYTMALTQAIVRNRAEHDIILALSGQFPESIEAIRSGFKELLPSQNIRTWHAPTPLREGDLDNDWRNDVARLIREAFIANLQPDVVYIASLFEGYYDDAVTSIGIFDSHTPVCVTFYDLIPLLNPGHYLKPDVEYHRHYLRKLEHLRRATRMLAISESSRREGIEQLGLDEHRVVNISTAADAHFRPLALSDEQQQAMRRKYDVKYGIKRPFVMNTGANDSRKNIDGLIRAYALLPSALRAQHQLVIVSFLPDADRLRLEALAAAQNLGADELLLIGYVDEDDLLHLYNLCRMFVFPSWHEGFGLPALEAMSCGRAVIASNTSSMPEVIGREDALFNPKSDADIAEKIARVLTDDHFRRELEQHGLQQAQGFSWDISARRAIAAMEAMHAEHINQAQEINLATRNAPAKPKLAYVSPLPPERTGIANYSAELLPALRENFTIELVTDQPVVTLPSGASDLPVRSVAWFKAHGHGFDRVLYQFGNSPYHEHMLDLVHSHPGVVMLHDFFLCSLLADCELKERRPGAWTQALYHSHGYQAVADRCHVADPEYTKRKYPCNLEVLQAAQGIIVHSAHSLQLARQWYGPRSADGWDVIPHVRQVPLIADRHAARKALGISEESFIVCSFGFVDPTKLSDRILDAWLLSSLAAAPDCCLILVGANHGGPYGQELSARIAASEYGARIRVAGWTEMPEYELYLQAADLAIQLRSTSRGETSGAVLDCMNYGLPTIVNAHGSMADLDDSGVWKMPDDFSNADLAEAMQTMWRDQNRRQDISRQALHIINTRHTPQACAALYAASIEKFHRLSSTNTAALVAALPSALPDPVEDTTLLQIAEAIRQSIPPRITAAQLLIDVSAIARNDLQTGIERVVRAQLSQLLIDQPDGLRVEPVYLSTAGGVPHYRYARQYMRKLLALNAAAMPEDQPVTVNAGDLFYGADFCPDDVILAADAGIFSDWRKHGVTVSFLIHDILPLTHPEFFPANTDEQHARWLQCIAMNADKLIGISQAVADDVSDWLTRHDSQTDVKQTAAPISVLHHGADIAASFPTTAIPGDAAPLLNEIQSADSFLMVGTIEPRKGHLQTLSAFEQLWSEGSQAKLVIVGREGWTALPTEQRRTIPQVMDKLRRHPELGKRLIWLAGISDEYLQQIYATCTCLIFASEGEGFGLPLIEAARLNRPIIARDIPVFYEVAQEHAYFFTGLTPEELAAAIRHWLGLHAEGKAPSSTGMQWNTWAQNSSRLMEILKTP